MSMGDKQYAENVAGSGGSGGAGEPADSFDEVATGLRDADGNMIYKKSYKGNTSANQYTIIDDSMNYQTITPYDVKGHSYFEWGNEHVECLINHYTGGDYSIMCTVNNGGVTLECGNHLRNREYYVTLYYIHKPVPRATARKKTVEE